MTLKKIPLNQTFDWEREDYQEDKFYHSDRELLAELRPPILPPYDPPFVTPKLKEYWRQRKLKKVRQRLAEIEKSAPKHQF